MKPTRKIIQPTHIQFLCAKSDVPNVLLPWLMNEGSLTKQFEKLAKQPLKVLQTQEGFQRLSSKQQLEFGKHMRPLAWVRKVELYGNENFPWALAQSIFPINCLHGKARRLKHLGKTPLGYVLFARQKPKCQRLISTRVINQEVCFVRQNYYLWYGKTLLVEEIFLPKFVDTLIKKRSNLV